jgi:hypothetical protein
MTLAVRDRLTIREVRLVHGDRSNEERVIGMVRNDGIQAVKRVRGNVTFRDGSGVLIDVKGDASLFDAILRPGEEIGFEITRDLGDYGEKDAVLRSRKAAAASVAVTAADATRAPTDANVASE